MKTYLISGTVTISVHTEVEAGSPREAREIAESRGFCPLGIPEQHGSSPEEDWCHSGEIDGEVENINVEEKE